MVIRNGILSTVRARGRTVLFSLLILLLTLSLSLGMGLWSYCAQTLEAMNQAYTSIALVEHMGENYPDPYAADDTARQSLAQLGDYSQVPGVTLWETTDWGVALSEGYQRPDGTIPYENQVVLAVFQITQKYVQESFTIELEDLPEEYMIREGPTCTVKTKEGMWEDIQYYSLLSSRKEDVRVVASPRLTLIDETRDITLDLSWMEEAGNVFDRGESYETDPATGESYWVEYFLGYRQAPAGYTGIIGKNLYSYEGKSGVLVEIDPGDSGFVPEPGKRYLLHGELYDSGSSSRAIRVTEFYEGCDQSPWVAFDSYDDPVFNDSIFTEYAQKYELGNNYMQVESSDYIAALEPFQQGTLYLTDGRYPEAGESGVCAITQDIAKQLNLKVGDTISLSMMQSTEYDPFALGETDDTRSWTVVGIVNQASGYEGRIWVSRGENLPQAPLFGYLLGRAVLDNNRAVEAVDQMEAMAPDGVRITLYDQGYAAVAQPLQAMESTAQGVTFASLVGVFAVLCLFAFLFVGRQQQAVDVMVSLGTPKGKIRLWLLSGVTLVAGVAVLVGMAVSAASMQLLITLALQGARALYAADRRYSNGALGATKEVELPQQVPLWPALVAGVVVFVAALILCVAFVGQAQRKNTLRQGKTRVRVPRSGTSVAGKGAVRFAWLSARRGGWRSVVVPVVALVLSGFLGFLMVTAQGWESQRRSLYDNTTITGQFTSANGRQYTDLHLSDPFQISESGMVSDIQVYRSYHYWLSKDMPQFADNVYGQDRRAGWIEMQEDMIFLNGFAVAPDFIYSEKSPEITWLEGWDEGFLTEPSNYTNGMEGITPCVASTRWMKEKGVELGDQISVYTELAGDIPVCIVGSFTPWGAADNLYAPLSCLQTDIADYLGCRFTLKSAYDLDDFREYLAQEEYSVPGDLNGNRIVVMLNDSTFTQTVEALGRYITLSQILFPVLFLLMGVMGFVVSWLMVNGRRMEFAIMRGLGASKKRVFGSFFLEQMGLCLMGCILSGVVLTLWSWKPMVWLASIGFALFYLAGCALAVRTVGRTKIFTLLTHAD